MALKRRGGLFNRVGIQSKFALAYAVLLLLFTATCVLFYAGLVRVGENRAAAAQTRGTLLKIEALRVSVLDQETGLRGYMVRLEESMLEPYYEGQRRFDQLRSELHELTTDDPLQQKLLEAIRDDMRRWRLDYAKPALELIRQSVLDASIRNRIDQLAGKRLIDGIRGNLDAMTAEENRILTGRNEDFERSLENTKRLAALMLLAGALFGIMVVRSTSRHISEPLSELTALMARLSEGDVGFETPHRQRGDEVGAIGRALEDFRVATRDLADREWVKTQLGALTTVLQTCKTRESYGAALVRRLCENSTAVYGAMFCLDSETRRYELVAGHAMPEGQYRARSFALGEGVLGQAAQDGRPTLLRNLPEDYFELRTALGTARPQVLQLLPLAGRDGAVGLVELALFAPTSGRESRLIEDAVTYAGLDLETLLRGLSTETLLEQTQQQNERIQASEKALRTQEEELRATNEILREKQQQLEEQAHRLRASEEELRAQSEELRITNAQLEEKSLELTQQKSDLEQAQAALEIKAVDLERASQYKSDFLANMSHELRTPLNSLLILAKGLADNEYNNLNDEQLESARIVYDSGKNLLALINDILDLSKIEAGKMDAVMEDFDLQPFVAGIERNFRMVARERKLEFKIESGAGLPARLRSDPGKITQIITNLLSNAFKFTHEGCVTLHIGRPAPDTRVSTGLDLQRCIAFRVADSGIGITPEKLGRLFQAFEQGDSGTSRRYGGTGLGLSICRGLARLLGGEISVTSEPGKGSSFTLLVPQSEGMSAEPATVHPQQPAARRVSAPAAAQESELAIALQDNGPAAMLIVEDDRQFAEVLAGLARAKGYRVLVANDGESALRLAARNKLSGVLLDIGLPGMDGWQVMEWLKDNPRTQQVPVHFISGTDDDSRARAMGAAGFLRKPVTQEQIGILLDALPASGAAPRRLLLVDDSAQERRLIRELLRDEKVEIDECALAEDALKKLTEYNYDLVVLDLGLPGMDGFEFLDIASKRGGMPPVVVHSGRELTREESMKLREYTDSVVLKSAPNSRRLLDEVTLFLHSIRRVAPIAEPAPMKPVLKSTFAGKTALIVDDDMRNMFALSKALRSHGFKVIMAQDGPKSLAQLDSSPEIAIVLMDIMMPGMDGYETMRRIRAQPRWQKLPIIAVTAKAMSGDREKCIEAGANDYCPKPIDVDQLLEQMGRLMV